MTLEERVTRLEQRTERLDGIESGIVGLRSDFNTFRAEQGVILGRILATLEEQGTSLARIGSTLEAIERRPGFRWPWEPRSR